MPSTVFNRANEIYKVLLDIGIGKKIRLAQLRDIIKLTAGANIRTIEQYMEFLHHFNYIRPAGPETFEILKKEVK